MDIEIKIEPEIHFDYNNELNDNANDIVEQDQNVLMHANEDNLNIIQEQEDMITVNVAELQTEEERNFIASLDLSKSIVYNFCAFCHKSFNNDRAFYAHKQHSSCRLFWLSSKYTCAFCNALTIDRDKHLALHKHNLPFCRMGCGKFFNNLFGCLEHEYRDHLNAQQLHVFDCRICSAIFSSNKELGHHVATSHTYVSCYICSLCRNTFESANQLFHHWTQNKKTCGAIPYDRNAIVSDLIPVNFAAVNANKRKALETTGDIATIKRIKPYENMNANEIFNFDEIKIKEEPIDKDLYVNTKEDIILDANAEVKIEIKVEPFDTYENDNIKEEETFETQPAININTNIDISKLRLPSIKNAEKSKTIIKKKDEKITLNVAPHKQEKRVSLLKINNTAAIIPPTNTIRKYNEIPPLRTIAKDNKIPPRTITKDFKILPSKIGKHNKIEQTTSANLKKAAVLKNGLKVFKLPPNAQLIPTNNIPTNIININNNNRQMNNLNVINLPATTKIVPLKMVPITVVPPTSVAAVAAAPGKNNIQALKTITNVRNVLCILRVPPNLPATNYKTIQDNKYANPLENFEKNIERRMTNDVMKQIEKLPEKRKVIEDLKTQLRQIETYTQQQAADGNFEENIPASILPKTTAKSATAIMQNEAIITNNNNNDTDYKVATDSTEPKILHLVFGANKNPELIEAQRLYTDYRFSWVCPFCTRQCELKYAFRKHLQSVHHLTKKDIEIMQFDVKPSKFVHPIEVKKVLKLTESLEVINTPNATETATPSVPGQMNISCEPKLPALAAITTIKTDPEESQIDERASNVSKANNANSPKLTITTTAQHTENDDMLEKQTEKFTCGRCKMIFVSTSALEEHSKIICSRPKIHECQVCHKRFTTIGTLNCHMTIHTGALPYGCNFCEKRFRTRGQVTVHHRTHTGERPFTCQVCSLGFTHRETLISHLSRHIGMKRYKCYGCDKTFSCISGLRTHRDVRPETCGRVKFCPRAIGPRVRVVRGNVILDVQPEVNPYLRSDEPQFKT